ncbi:MAG: M50 family metallopeptidase [Kofleriaceae bacterium]
MPVERRLALVAAVAGLYAVPYAGYLLYPLLLVATSIHELAHAVVAVLTGGTVATMTVRADGSGLTTHVGGAAGPIALAGPLGPAVVGALLVAVAARPARVRGVLVAVAAAVLLGALAWTGASASVTGVAIVTPAGLAVVTWRWPATQGEVAGAGGAALGLAWLAGREALFTATATSDTSQLAAAYGGHPTHWAITIGAASSAALLLAVVASPRARRPQPRRR